MFEKTGRFHRVPVGFGPAPTPRQDSNGVPFPTWKDARTEVTGVVVNVDRESLQAVLPEGYTTDPDVQPTVLFEVMNLRNLPWLAGRGYNTWGVYANDIVCSRVQPPVKASYMLVLFESFTDPITTGREELGFSKLWAEIPDTKIADGNLVHTAGWFGNEFMRLEVPDLEFKQADESPSFAKRPYTMPSVDGFLHHRYVPAVGEPGKHDASYATLMRGPGDAKPRILKFATTSGKLNDIKLTITKRPWEELPTLWNVVDGLSTLAGGGIQEMYYEVRQGANDLAENRRIEF